ncbi:alkaline phosphatase PafA [Robiginitalea aurantiaca]|uniref:Alkaline phosphatase family protein n=1 Tax=Robiginitalea aurantiaca TaxID=3056915 RepID=A0ABT7WHA4_9FLAO|nr:alkaline phosphatase PafA [Robiginitalea aurantiaca]MDM9632300.1 alkaline phosphatase family protein [Robiginitalea aurantiaca]
MSPKLNFLRGVLTVFFLGCFLALQSQVSIRERESTSNESVFEDPPRLVVGIVVDQMRYDYLTRFWPHYKKNGFKRLVEEGFLSRNHHFGYAPTSTGPGHASVYTGTTPSVHGIIGNSWYDKQADSGVYCVGDPSQKSVGTAKSSGQHSPHRMTVTTITDQLRLHYHMRSKVIAVAIKDRGSVIPGGHTANAAYWFEGGDTGNWISSSYYMENLPAWVQEFNASDAAENYKKIWKLSHKPDTYVESGPDNVPYEGLFQGEKAPVFPHDLPALWATNGMYELIKATPFGNSLTTDFALEAIEQEDLGADEITDFLAISFSSTDYVGHKYGVNSKEIQDTYIRLDADIERLLKELDRKVGEGAYAVFLTADHGVVPVPAYLSDSRIPAGYLDKAAMNKQLSEFLSFTYGTSDLVKSFSNNQLFLDHNLMRNLELEPERVRERLAEELLRYDGVFRVYTAGQMRSAEYTEGIPAILQNGFNQKRSGDVILVPMPAHTDYSKTGTTHGSPFIYDTHVPLIFYGKGFRKGSITRPTYIRDIAPTLAVMLGIAFPNGSTGTPIEEVLK